MPSSTQAPPSILVASEDGTPNGTRPVASTPVPGYHDHLSFYYLSQAEKIFFQDVRWGRGLLSLEMY